MLVSNSTFAQTRTPLVLQLARVGPPRSKDAEDGLKPSQRFASASRGIPRIPIDPNVQTVLPRPALEAAPKNDITNLKHEFFVRVLA